MIFMWSIPRGIKSDVEKAFPGIDDVIFALRYDECEDLDLDLQLYCIGKTLTVLSKDNPEHPCGFIHHKGTNVSSTENKEEININYKSLTKDLCRFEFVLHNANSESNFSKLKNCRLVVINNTTGFEYGEYRLQDHSANTNSNILIGIINLQGDTRLVQMVDFAPEGTDEDFKKNYESWC